MSKPILCLDFDGVIHSYVSGWKGADVIPDPPVPGAMEFINAARHKFEIAISSSRSSQSGGILAMQVYIAEHLNEYVQSLREPYRESWAADFVTQFMQWPTEKPSAFVTLDDRAITFCGRWPSILELLDFKPWTKQPAQGPFAYTSKPTHIEAFLWTGQSNTSATDVPMWFIEAVLNSIVVVDSFSSEPTVLIRTSHGGVKVGLGVYIIRDATTGELYPCDQETFERKYSKA